MPTMAPHDDQLTGRAAEIASVAAAAAGRSEAAGRLVPELIDAIRASGLAGMGLPPDLGGSASPPGTMVGVVETIAAADAATAWVLMITATAGLGSVYLPKDSARRVWSDGPRTLAAGVFAPKGVARRVPEGYRVSGRWPFGSGILHASWVSGGVLMEGDETRTVHTAHFPAADATILDTWHVMGLEATGSHDFSVDDLVVPADLITSIDLAEPWSGEALYRFPIYGLLAVGVAAVCLGAARGAIEELVELATGKVPTGSRRTLAERPAVQESVARSTTRLGAARAYLDEVMGSLWERTVAGDALDGHDRARIRMAATHAVEAAAEVAVEMYRTGGGTSVYTSSPLQKRFRDVHTAAQHMMVSRPTWEVSGRTLLGLEEGHLHL